MNVSRQKLEQWDREHVWHPFTPMGPYAAERPLIIREARGCLLIDLDGREYIDGVSSLWCNIHGHRVPELDFAVRAQLDQVAHSTLLGASNVPAIRLARRLVERAPPGLTRVFYSDDGATAVEVALKMAFQFWRQCPQPRPEKTKFLALAGPITAIRWATLASATSAASTISSRRCCFPPSGRRSTIVIAARLVWNARPAGSIAPTSWPTWCANMPISSPRSPSSRCCKARRG